MLRIIVRESDVGDAVNAEGPVLVSYRTFDVDLPEVEEWLRYRDNYKRREFIGAELLPAGADHAR